MALFNMSCGQTQLHPKCLEILSQQITGPIYYPDYWKLEIETISLLRRLIHTQNDILLLAGSATYGEEAALLSLMEPGEKVLVANAGMYGQVAVDVTRIVAGTPVNLQASEGQIVPVEEIRSALMQDPHIRMVIAVHCDTSTGVMSPVAQVGKMLAVEFPETLFMVDAVSSAAGVELFVDDWNIDICFTSPQKCINAPQGLAIVSVSSKAWEKIKRRKTPIHSLCMDLNVWKDYHDGVVYAYNSGSWKDISTSTSKAIHGPSPSYTLVAGLHASLLAILDEGLPAVYTRHSLAGKALREGLLAMGVGVLAQEEVAAPMATRLVFSKPLDWTEISGRMLNDHSIALASGTRIGAMGISANSGPVLATLQALEKVLQDLGYPVSSGWETAKNIYKQSEAIV